MVRSRQAHSGLDPRGRIVAIRASAAGYCRSRSEDYFRRASDLPAAKGWPQWSSLRDVQISNYVRGQQKVCAFTRQWKRPKNHPCRKNSPAHLYRRTAATVECIKRRDVIGGTTTGDAVHRRKV